MIEAKTASVLSLPSTRKMAAIGTGVFRNGRRRTSSKGRVASGVTAISSLSVAVERGLTWCAERTSQIRFFDGGLPARKT